MYLCFIIPDRYRFLYCVGIVGVNVDVISAIETMRENSGTTWENVKNNLSLNSNSIQASLSRGSVPRADTLSKLARACGYRLALVPVIMDSDHTTIYIDD